MNAFKLRITVVATIGCLLAMPAFPQTLQIYDSELEFFANADIYSTENFDSYPTDTMIKSWSVVFDDVIYEIANGEFHDCTIIPGDICWQIRAVLSDGPPPVSPPNLLNSESLGELDTGDGWDVISFGDNQGVHAFGFYFLSSVSYDFILRNNEFSPFFGWEIAIHECNGTTTFLDVPPETAIAAAYFGFVSSVKICKIEVATQLPPVNIAYSAMNWAYDSVSRSAITPIVQEVSISIRARKIQARSRGRIWVAILSNTDNASPFDPASQVDIPTVEFGPDGAKAKRYKVRDINKDGLGDLLLRFKIRKTGIACRDTEATLTGKTFDGLSFTGTDSIRTARCKPKKCHKMDFPQY